MRRVQLTQDGQAFYERSKDQLADVDELQTMFQQPGLFAGQRHTANPGGSGEVPP